MADSLTAPKVLTSRGSGQGSRDGFLNLTYVKVGAAAGTDIEVDAQAVYQLISVPAGVFVYAVLARIITGFTASVTMTLGDGDSAAGFLASADIAPTVAETAGLWKHSRDAAEAYAAGKKYLAADTIDAPIAGATPAAGLMEMIVLWCPLTLGTT
jgi:hypothetical protein